MSYFVAFQNYLKSCGCCPCSKDYYHRERNKVLEGLRNKTMSLKDVGAPWDRYHDIVWEAITIDPLSIRFVPCFQDDLLTARRAILENGLARVWISKRLQKDKKLERIAQSTLPWDRKAEFPLRNKDRFFIAKSAPASLIKCLHALKGEIYQTEVQISLENDAASPNDAAFPAAISHDTLLEEPSLNDAPPQDNGLKKKPASVFIRDSHVTLFEGGHLLPYPLSSEKNFRKHLACFIPSSAYHFFTPKERPSSGKGFRKENIEQAMISAYDHDIPFKRGATCIEGGNCYLFISKGERKAVIGEMSLYLSLMALREQGYFNSIPNHPHLEVSEEAYRIARNLKIYNQVYNAQDVVLSPEAVFQFYQQIFTPLSEEERLAHFEEAQDIEFQLQVTQQQIALELQVPLPNIAFIPQTFFHIDLETFVTPMGELALHDPEQMPSFLSEITPLTAPELQLLEEYKRVAAKKSLISNPLQQIKVERLKKIDVAIHLIPAVLKTSSKSSIKSALNYCNGLFVNKKTDFVLLSPHSNRAEGFGIKKEDTFSFITTGPSVPEETVFHHRFLEIFQKTFPQITLQAVPGMSQFIAQKHGGVHCLSFESSLG